MQNEFTRGKIIVTSIVAITLFINGTGIWFARTWLLKWYAELAQSLTDPAARESIQILQTWFVMNQKSFLTNQGLNYGVVIFMCLLLYLGYNWLRWLWAIHWLARGIAGTFVSIVAFVYIEQFNRLLGLGLLISLIYVVCGLLMICAPSVRIYMNAMRRPASRFRRI